MGASADGLRMLRGKVEEFFTLNEVIASTLTAQAFKAIECETDEEVVVWKTRGPIAKAEVKRFTNRLATLQKIPKVQRMRSFGVDRDNIGYAVLGPLRGKPLDSRANDLSDLEERYLDCVSVVEAIHGKALACGDLCLESFTIGTDRSATLFGVLGDVELKDKRHESNQALYRCFRPPEQGSGGQQSPSVDVYALSWIAEKLFSGQVFKQASAAAAPPGWLKDILQATSSKAAREETSSALALRIVLKAAREEATPNREDDARKFALAEVVEKPKATQKIELPRYQERGSSGGPGTKRSVWSDFLKLAKSPSVRLRTLLMLNIAALGVLFFTSAEHIKGRSAELLVVMAVPELPVVELDELYASDEPAIHQGLLDALALTPPSERRGQILRGIFARSRRIGLVRASDVALRQFKRSTEPDTFGSKGEELALLKVIDPLLSQNLRLDQIVAIYDANPHLSVLLAAAVALDTGDAETFRGVFAKAVSALFGIADGGEHSLLALMLLIPEIHDLFSQDLLSLEQRLTADDIVWLLQHLGKQGRAEVSTVAQLAYHRHVLKGPGEVFLKELRRGVALSPAVNASLVAGVLGQLTERDVATFGQWYGQGVDRVLEAGILTSKEPAVSSAAFEVLSSKPISDPYVEKVLEFIRATYKAEGGSYAHLVASLALRDVIKREALKQQLMELQKAPRVKELMGCLMRGAPIEVLEVLLATYKREIDPVDIIELLAHTNKQVRLAALHHLTTVNDILLLKLIKQSYDEEKDLDVRALYEAKIDIIRERVASAKAS